MISHGGSAHSDITAPPLARGKGTQSRRAEARALLAEIFGWFTDGSETAVLKDAKALLHELDDRSEETSSVCKRQDQI